ncbi:hypothetical protein ES319_D12G269600v1 [Gossypium barbadense]|uniref:FMN-dependent dehydrogenase domain-containing protein n=4 Tax=Gossypium TaxID=3633 RepID=A0A5J5P3F9_GOSBA|nr:hypothetical protein ES319_D12G269600v1 [Gossypium barbadense]
MVYILYPVEWEYIIEPILLFFSQLVVERMLASEGIKRVELGRDELEKRVWEWKEKFRPRILIDVSKIDMTTTVLGFKISMPIMIAPTTMQKMAHPEDSSLETCGIQEV